MDAHSNLALSLRRLVTSGDGLLARWIDRLGPDPRILWYPSAGDDLRDLLYLDPRCHGTECDPAPPDLFIHTDYMPFDHIHQWDPGPVFDDHRTTIEAVQAEPTLRLHLPASPRLVDFPHEGERGGFGVFCLLDIRSRQLGRFTRPLLHLQVENAAFCEHVLLPAGARVSHVVNIRHGVPWGGGKTTGRWIEKLFGLLRTELHVTDADERPEDEDLPFEVFPALAEARTHSPQVTRRRLRALPGVKWSRFAADVVFHEVRRREET